MSDEVAHLRELMDERDRRYSERFEAAQQALSKAEKADAERFAAVNEFRGQLSDQVNTFIPRSEAQALISAGDERLQLQIQANANALQALTETVNQQVIGRGLGLDKAWGYIVGVIGIITAVLAVIISSR